MKRRLLAACVPLLFSGIAHADHREAIEKLVQPLVDERYIVGCVVGVIEDGKPAVYSFGRVRKDKDEKPTADTIYEIGSMTKAFTGVLLADAENRGTLKIEDKLQDHLPKDVTLQEVDGKPIRLVDLASQSSGLPRMPGNFAPKDAANPYVDYTPAKLYAFLSGYKPTRPPGTYEYSNLGLGLLGQLLAERAGKSYEALLVERICDPLKMSDTRLKLSADQLQRFAPPHTAELKPDHPWEFDALAGAGAIRSSVNDMLKFLAASISGEKCEINDAIQKSWVQRLGPPEQADQPRVALAWHIAGDGQTRWHNGQTGGYASTMFVYAPKKTAVVVLCNTASSHINPLGEKIIQTVLGMKVPPLDLVREIQVKPEALARYAGKYQLAPGVVLTVTVDDGHLVAQLTGQDAFKLSAKSDTEFFYRVVDAQITFDADGDGPAKSLTLHQNGRDIPAKRVE